MLSLYEILKASKTGIAPDLWTALAGRNWNGTDTGHEVKELTGIPPLSIRSNGTMLLDYLISGNMSQSGTPSPTTPIQPQECGERTGNLLATLTEKYAIDASGNINSNSAFMYYTAPCEANETYTFSLDSGLSGNTVRIHAFNGDTWIEQLKGEHIANAPFTVTTPANTTNLKISITKLAKTYHTMLNVGETALLYEPYGIKIPISSGGENLFDKDNYNIVYGYFIAEGTTTITGENNNNIVYIPCKPNTTYTVSKILSTRFGVGYTIDKPAAGVTVYGAVIGYTATSLTVTTDSSAKYIVAYVRNGNAPGTSTLSEIVNSLQITESSEPLPYEPYNRTTTPIYLGEVQTMRRIKKLVLTGDENVTMPATSSFQILGVIQWGDINGFCTHYPQITWNEVSYATKNGFAMRASSDGADRFRICDLSITTVADFKSYLAQQYSAGTPVCVWYVLAEPTTGIVNEPLRKIGDYADTLSMEQAGVQIPTNKGNTVIDVETELKPSQMYIKYRE